MSRRHLVQIDADKLEEAAFNTGVDIVRDTSEERMYLTLDGITFWAEIPGSAVTR